MTITEIVAIASVLIALISLIITIVKLFQKLSITTAELRVSNKSSVDKTIL